ncbi:MAG: AAA family ATPase [Bacteroidetes bacterium]|nr:AAA family ATPase [Bacteroidota bacterium]
MNQIFLPSLLSLNIRNFSLYPNNGGLDFHYDFKNGLNLFVGGNGTGKTTLTKLIKFALIGHYREQTDTSIYKGVERIKRPEYPKNYYRNRMDDGFANNNLAEVTLTFNINNSEFSVTRNLYDISLTKATVKKSGKTIKLEGVVISQEKYEKLSEKEKQKHLQFKYEELVTEAAQFGSFDGLIFFVNEILYFGEDRNLILWDWNIQEELSSKYFNDPALDTKRSKLKLKQKNFDTQARQTSEEIKAITDAINQAEKAGSDKNLSGKDAYVSLNDLKTKLDKEEAKILSLQKERVECTEQRKYLNSMRIKISQQLNELENDIKIEEGKVHDIIWRNKNPKYEVYQKHLKNNRACPACNQALSDKEFSKVYETGEDCFVCHKPLKSNTAKSPKLLKLSQELEKKQNEQVNTERKITEIEKKLDDLDSAYNKLDVSVFNLKTEIRKLDFEINQDQSKNKGKEPSPDDFKRKLQLVIKELEEKKKKYQEESKNYGDEVAKINKQMNDMQVKIVSELSKIFSKFASNFLGIECVLVNEDVVVEKGRRIKVFLPRVGKEIQPREEEEAFSESQRFFVDLSFRMSLLNYFYKEPAFFICETPDSSLDISYERNAAEVFLEYLKQKNALVITSNLNNSDFLSYILKNAPDKNHINLLKIGRISNIQSDSKILIQTNEKIEKLIYDRR